MIVKQLREERRLRVFENWILRRIFGPKSDANGEWRSVHNEELNSVYSSPDIGVVNKSRRLIWAGHVARIEKGRSAFKIIIGTPLGRPRHRWEDNIRMGPKEIRISTRNYVDSVQDCDYWRVLVNTTLNVPVP